MEKEKEENKLQCECCGKIGGDVKKTYDPYDADVYNDKHEAILCDDCFQNKSDDV